jgi:hypothetical protein
LIRKLQDQVNLAEQKLGKLDPGQFLGEVPNRLRRFGLFLSGRVAEIKLV